MLDMPLKAIMQTILRSWRKPPVDPRTPELSLELERAPSNASSNPSYSAQFEWIDSPPFSLEGEENDELPQDEQMLSQEEALLSQEEALLSQKEASLSKHEALLSKHKAIVSEQKAILSQLKPSMLQQEAVSSEHDITGECEELLRQEFLRQDLLSAHEELSTHLEILSSERPGLSEIQHEVNQGMIMLRACDNSESCKSLIIWLRSMVARAGVDLDDFLLQRDIIYQEELPYSPAYYEPMSPNGEPDTRSESSLDGCEADEMEVDIEGISL
ncbi:hypothetical protein F5Y14DRAFT_107591 [Nemania sp. NC0429]|nr:hypothetical protein F5Y14DRAFT_107591 [Nemania sp. NC0429]